MSVVMRAMEKTLVIIVRAVNDRESSDEVGRIDTGFRVLPSKRSEDEAVGTRSSLNHRLTPRWKQFVYANKFKTVLANTFATYNVAVD